MKPVSDETRTIRRTMRDLVALSALPAVWAGYRPRQVAEGLADVLLSTLRLDLVYLRLPGQTDGQEIEVARTAGRPTTTGETRDIGRALAPCLDGGTADSTPSIPNPAGGGTVRLVIVRVGGDREDGVLVAGSQQTGFPSEADHLLLTVGANQASALLQRQRAKEVLRRQAELLRLSYDAILVWRLDGGIESWSRGAEELYGFAEAEALGRVTHELLQTVHPVPWPEIEAKLRGSGSWEGELRHRTKDGREVIVSTRQQFVRDADEVWRVLETNRDITESKQAVEAIRASNDRFRMVTKATNDAVWDWDLNTNKVWWNESVLTLFGYRLEAIEADPAWWLERIHPDDREAVEAFFFEVVRGKEQSWVDEYRFRCADGSYKDVYDRGYVLRDGEGRATRMIGAMLDISARKRAEEALRASEAWFRFMANAMPQIVWTARPDGSPEYLNDRFVEYTGLPVAEVTGERWLSVLHPDDRERTMTRWMADVATGSDHDIEFRLRAADGRYRWFKCRGLPVRDESGQVVKWLGTVTDIDDQKRAEEVLRESEHRWRSLTEALPQLVWTATPDGSCDYFSTQWTQHTGIPEGELLRWRWLDVLHPDDREPTRQLWTASVEGGGPYDVEYRVRRSDGVYRWFKTRGVPIRDSEGSIFKWFGTCTDITDLRQAEEALRESEARFRGTFENAAVGIAHTHPTGRLLRVNEKFCAIVGYPREELLQKTFQDITHPDDLAVSLGSLAALMRGQLATLEHEKRYLRKDGSPVWVELFTSLQRDAAGQSAYAIAVIQDISERKRLDGELRHAKEAAEAANRAKDEFLANVSHEIRTPMNAILGMTELVLDTPLTEDQRQCLKTVKSAADNLLALINDLLDFAKIEAGKLELDPADFSLRTAVGDTLRALAVRAHKKGLELVCQVQPDVPDALIGDAGRLRQVLLNLIGNAVKFTDEGEVVVCVSVTDETDRETGRPFADRETGRQGDKEKDGGSFSLSPCLPVSLSLPSVSLSVQVKDTGIGIPQEKQEGIFRAFEQEDASTTRKYGGTGLGLTIAARLVALMGGQITVASQPGRGSTFTFTAQFGRQPNPPPGVAWSGTQATTGGPPVLLRDLSVLVVDDNATNRRILEGWLRGWQMKPVTVGDGVAAMDALWHGTASGSPYPLVLLDARMPDTDGLALATYIRQRAELSSARIILLTSGDRPGDLGRFREQRINAHLLKPVQQELLETIYRVMSRTSEDREIRSRGDGKSSVTPAPSRPLRILVAEDNEFNAQLLEQLLARRGHRARLADNGREALVLAEGGGFDLLLLDLHMPELDGFQVIQAIRERERSQGGHLPVIALTARSRKEDRERCLAAGMDDFLTKPIQAPDLWAAIDRAGGACPPPPPSLSPKMGEGRGGGAGLLDPRVVLAACGDDDAILEKICQAFRARLPDYLTAVQDALRERDAPRLREAAHKLCGMVAAFSTVAGCVASDLEDHAARGQLEEARPLVGQLETMAQELVRVVSGLSVETLRQQAVNP